MADFLIPSQAIRPKRQPQSTRSHQQKDATQARISQNKEKGYEHKEDKEEQDQGHVDYRQEGQGSQSLNYNNPFRQQGRGQGLLLFNQDFRQDRRGQEQGYQYRYHHRHNRRGQEEGYDQYLHRHNGRGQHGSNCKLQQPGDWVGISVQTRNSNQDLVGQRDVGESFYGEPEETQHREFEEYNNQDTNQYKEPEEGTQYDVIQEHIREYQDYLRSNISSDDGQGESNSEYEEERSYDEEPEYKQDYQSSSESDY